MAEETPLLLNKNILKWGKDTINNQDDCTIKHTTAITFFPLTSGSPCSESKDRDRFTLALLCSAK